MNRIAREVALAVGMSVWCVVWVGAGVEEPKPPQAVVFTVADTACVKRLRMGARARVEFATDLGERRVEIGPNEMRVLRGGIVVRGIAVEPGWEVRRMLIEREGKSHVGLGGYVGAVLGMAIGAATGFGSIYDNERIPIYGVVGGVVGVLVGVASGAGRTQWETCEVVGMTSIDASSEW